MAFATHSHVTVAYTWLHCCISQADQPFFYGEKCDSELQSVCTLVAMPDHHKIPSCLGAISSDMGPPATVQQYLQNFNQKGPSVAQDSGNQAIQQAIARSLINAYNKAVSSSERSYRLFPLLPFGPYQKLSVEASSIQKTCL